MHATLDYKRAIGEQLQRLIAEPVVDLVWNCNCNVILHKLLTCIDPWFRKAFNTYITAHTGLGTNCWEKNVRPSFFFFLPF